MADSCSYRFGDFELDPGRFKLLRHGVRVPLEPKALDLLILLVERAPRVVDKSEIFATVWKDVAVSDNALTRLVTQLRKALGDHPKSPRYLETVATRGYRFCGEVGRAPAATAPAASAAPAMPADPGPMRSVRVAAVVPPLVIAALLAASMWSRDRPAGTYAGSAETAAATEGTGHAAFAALRPRQISTGTGYEGFLAFAADGKSVAFASDRSGALEIYVQGTAPGSEPAALTGNGRQNVQPAWSPDGQFIAYHEMARGGIWMIPSRGGVARQVSPFGAHPAWSPDGRVLAFQSLSLIDLTPQRAPGVPSSIWTVDALGGGTPVRLTRTGDPPGPHLAPAWSDARTIVFAVPGVPARGTDGSLWTADAETAQVSHLTSHELLSYTYALTPGGRGAFFAGKGSGAIWWLPVGDDDADEPMATGLPAAGSMVSHLTVSPDGRQLAWSVVDSSSHVWAASYAASGRMRPAALTEGAGVHYGFPAPSGDGRLALVGSRHGAAAVLYLLTGGGAPRQLTMDTSGHGRPHWMPGGGEVAFVSTHGGDPGVWAIDPESGRERRLFGHRDLGAGLDAGALSTLSNVAISPAFDQVAMSLVKDGVPNVWVAPLESGRPGGPARQVTFERDGGSYPSWSPDGRWIAYQRPDGSDTQVCIVAADGSGRTQLTEAPGQSWNGGWGPTSNSILLAVRRDGFWNVAELTRSTRAVRGLTDFREPRVYVRRPQWDAAARRVVFERAEAFARIWSVEMK